MRLLGWFCVSLLLAAPLSHADSKGAPLFGACLCLDSIHNHSADYNPPDWQLQLSELLRVIQFFNAGAYHPVATSSEDGFRAGPGDAEEGCRHDADYQGSVDGPDARIDLSELLRVVQLYNYGDFRGAPIGVGTEDGFDLGAASELKQVNRAALGPPVGNEFTIQLTVPQFDESVDSLTIREELPSGWLLISASYTPVDAAPTASPNQGATILEFVWDFAVATTYPEYVQYTVQLPPEFIANNATLIKGSLQLAHSGACNYGIRSDTENLFKPVLSLNGNATEYADCNGEYVDPGATALDLLDGDLSGNVIAIASGFPLKGPGSTGFVTYRVYNGRGIGADPLVRKVVVSDQSPPILTVDESKLSSALDGLASVVNDGGTFRLATADPCAPQIPNLVELNDSSVDPFFSATDACGGNDAITYRQLTSICDGVVTVYLEARDNYGNKARHEVYLELTDPGFTQPVVCTKKPNVLFIVLDDQNDWVGYLGGHPDASTPNLDRLAESGRPFMNAFSAGTISNASRTSLFSGLNPTSTGVYSAFGRWYNRDNELGATVMPSLFGDNGFQTFCGGKCWFPYFTDPVLLFNRATWCTETHNAWDHDGNTCPVGFPSCIRNYETTNEGPAPIGALNLNFPEVPGLTWGTYQDNCTAYMGDTKVVAQVVEWLDDVQDDAPFFIMAGILRPHTPVHSPRKYLCRFGEVHLPAPLGFLTPEQITRRVGSDRPLSPCGAPYPGLAAAAANPPCDDSGFDNRFPCSGCECADVVPANPIAPPCPGGHPDAAPCDTDCQESTGLLPDTELPYGYTVDDILYDSADLPSRAVEGTQPSWHHRIIERQEWCNGVRAYLAATSYSDDMLGVLMDNLEASGKIHNTIVVAFGDHGLHLGEKDHWLKSALWERTTHTPLVIKTPCQPEPGEPADAPVSLVDIYPTIAELSGLTIPNAIDGISLVNLLEDASGVRNIDPNAPSSEPVLMSFMGCDGAGSVQPIHAVRDERYRYIQYDPDDPTQAELYDLVEDPYEIRNLLYRDGVSPEEQAIVQRLKLSIPANPMPPYCCTGTANCGTAQCANEKSNCFNP